MWTRPQLAFSQNSTRTIRLLVSNFYDVVDEAVFGLITYHLVEISVFSTLCLNANSATVRKFPLPS